MHKKYDARKVGCYRSYTIADLCRIYSDQKLHPQTVREWINDKKLEAMTHGRVIFICGAVWKQFICDNNKKNRRKLEFKELKCFKCKVIATPLNNTVHELKISNSGSLSAAVICQNPNCHHKNLRLYKRTEYKKLYDSFLVLHDEVASLSDSSNSPSKAHLKAIGKEVISESLPKEVKNSVIPPNKTNINLLQTNFLDLL